MQRRSSRLLPLLLTVAAVGCGGSSPVATTDEPALAVANQTPDAAPAAATTPVATPSDSALVRVTTDTYDGVIIPPDDAYVPGRFFHHEIQGAWMPTADDIDALESRLGAYLAGERPDLVARLGTYVRQYVGLLQGTDERIWASFLCTAHEGWDRRAVEVDDGGDCYFQVMYDVAARAFLFLDVNGEA